MTMVTTSHAVREKVSTLLDKRLGLSREEFVEALGLCAGMYIDMNWLPEEREGAITKLLEAVHSITGDKS